MFKLVAKTKLIIIKKSSTLLERAQAEVPGFSAQYKKLQRSVALAGRSASTLTNYGRCLDQTKWDFILGEVIQPKSTPTLHRICPACKKGVLETVYSFDQRGPPVNWRSLFEYLLS